MIKEIQLRVDPRTAHYLDAVEEVVAKQEGIMRRRLSGVRIIKRSIDARKEKVMVNLKVRAYIDEPMKADYLVPPIVYRRVKGDRQAIVVGAGPGGLFAALRLIELGVKPIVLERGKNVRDRRIDVAAISRQGIVDPDSNYCFGEGGAGAYSDGKLYTRSKKRGSVERILGIFHQHGASEDILIDAHPHIGSDKLPGIIENMRNTILDCGGEVHFGTRVTELIISDAREVIGVKSSTGEEFHGPVILATGHSARDVYEMLHEANISMEEKGIAVGVRLEHPQHIIDQIQYHKSGGRGDYLPAAEYSFVTQINDRGVYSFCMCPGGVVVPAASQPGQLVVNGMSPSTRGTYWANSGMVVEVRPEDLKREEFSESFDPSENPDLSVLAFQEHLERLSWQQGGRRQTAPAQRMADFVNGRLSYDLPASSYAPGLVSSPLHFWMPKFISERLQEGFRIFGRKQHGFLTNEATVIAIETRTSAPVRILRNGETLQHVRLEGLYPCGEGAGYAGGIVSAAIDGERCAEACAALSFLQEA